MLKFRLTGKPMKTYEVAIQYCVVTYNSLGELVRGRPIQYDDVVSANSVQDAIKETFEQAKQTIVYPIEIEFLSALWVKEIDFNKVMHI